MADIGVERKKDSEDDNKKNNSKWWVLLVLVIVGIIVLWYAFSDTGNKDPENGPDVEDNLHIEEPIGSAEITAMPLPETGEEKELTNQFKKTELQAHGLKV